MKKYVIFLAFLISSKCFALNEQIQSAQNYFNQINATATTHDEDDLHNHQAMSLSRELSFGQKSDLLKIYQEQNHLTVSGIYDSQTLKFVQQQQQAFGYHVTKVLDNKTWFATYSQPLEWQKIQIQDAIEQWQQVLEKQRMNNTSRFIVVNIPSQSLTLYEWDGTHATLLMRSNVVIGKINTQTPMDDFFIWGIKYHPTWTPTNNILKRHVYKDGHINTQWLRSHGIQAINSAGQVLPLNALSSGNGVRFMQPAGNNNALGILKFETTSTENIYLHDTNEKYLFLHNLRAYSSGCVRVEDFKSLAQALTGLDSSQLGKKLANHNTRIEKIEKTPVYFTYTLINFLDDKVVFFPDVYRLRKDIIYQR